MMLQTHTERPLSAAPLVCMSGGIFLVIAGMLAMLPGRDTASYLQNGGARTLKEAMKTGTNVAAHTERALPGKQSFVLTKGRFYHWDTKCQLLNPGRERKEIPVHEMTRSEAEKEKYFACDFCERHEF